MLPLTTLYDKYIDQRKLSEQKNPFEYIVPPSINVVGNNKYIKLFKQLYKNNFKKFSFFQDISAEFDITKQIMKSSNQNEEGEHEKFKSV